MCSKPIAWLWKTKLAESNPFSRQCDVSGAHMTTTISNEKAPDTGESKTLELPVGEPRSSVRGHCLWAQKKVPIDAPLRPLAYDRMFPDLPLFALMRIFCVHWVAWVVFAIADVPKTLLSLWETPRRA